MVSEVSADSVVLVQWVANQEVSRCQVLQLQVLLEPNLNLQVQEVQVELAVQEALAVQELVQLAHRQIHSLVSVVSVDSVV